jgi:5-methylcytosine-specific restriction protein B
MPERTRELIEVGYYLSRFGTTNPPVRFGDANWNVVYDLFYSELGNGRNIIEFQRSLKNTRDGFDSYFPKTKREGWKDKSGNPAKLSLESQNVFDQFQYLSEEEIFNRIKVYMTNIEGLEVLNSLKKHILQEMDVNSFRSDAANGSLYFPILLSNRIVGSLLTKPFVILTGLSGSGKTKLAQAFSMWIAESKDQYGLVPVGADWTNREPLLGYPNSLNSSHYVTPDSGVLDILLRAHTNYQENNSELALCKPFFLILDEMNLSHVERYFADFLSAMESGDAIKLYSGGQRYSKLDANQNPITSSSIPNEVKWPKNLFIIGTVNIDETTYMFSPKVLDRANSIEFRIGTDEMSAYFENHSKLDLNLLLEDIDANRGKGAASATEFMRLAAREGIILDRKSHQETFVRFFAELQNAGAEFGYRTANEMTELMAFLSHFNVDVNDAYDIAIMQKLLPKLHGSRSKLNKIIPPLLSLCEKEGEVIYPLSHEKLSRMKRNADENGFASYAEA